MSIFLENTRDLSGIFIHEILRQTRRHCYEANAEKVDGNAANVLLHNIQPEKWYNEKQLNQPKTLRNIMRPLIVVKLGTYVHLGGNGSHYRNHEKIMKSLTSQHFISISIKIITMQDGSGQSFRRFRVNPVKSMPYNLTAGM